jgi:hypothetical protein
MLLLAALASAGCTGSPDGSSGTLNPLPSDGDTGTAPVDPGPPETMHVPYGDGENQWLNLYVVDSDAPTPIYLFSHANGSTADDVGGFVAKLQNEGISTISWESVVLPDGSGEDLVTGWSDAQLMLDWVKEHGPDYNLDPSRLIVGGRSRGSIFSWELAHSDEPAIKGIYMFQALPDSAWLSDDWNPTVEVHGDSPPMKLTYIEPRHTDDGHDPDNGYAIAERYEALGIGDRAEVAENVGSESGLYVDIGAWCRDMLGL